MTTSTTDAAEMHKAICVYQKSINEKAAIECHYKKALMPSKVIIPATQLTQALRCNVSQTAIIGP
jgi:hypothetical protein